MLEIKEKHPDDLKALTFDDKFVCNRHAGKEISFSLPEETFRELLCRSLEEPTMSYKISFKGVKKQDSEDDKPKGPHPDFARTSIAQQFIDNLKREPPPGVCLHER